MSTLEQQQQQTTGGGIACRTRNRRQADAAPRVSGPAQRHRALAALLTLLATLVGSCTSIDFDSPKPSSTAFEGTEDTFLGRAAASLPELPTSQASFYALEDGVEALSVRLLMARRAERSIDAQYYLISDDVTGNLFVRELLEAADRGVRVRLLLDDIQTVGYDRGMRALAAHPDIELRIFNPFVQRRWRALSVFTGDFSRVNRRMHNKSFTADNQFTVIGGRNIAAEYFGADREIHFGDLDLLGIGSVAKDVSRMFDSYWNDRLAVPVETFAGRAEDPEHELRALREHLDATLEDLHSTPYADLLQGTMAYLTAKSGDELIQAPYQLVYDPPAKGARHRAEDLETILTPLREAVLGAQSELIVLSPYFVPRKRGVAGFKALRERGVRTLVVTNSLAANNHSMVHAGYMGYRKPLLKLGVELYEVRSDAVGRGPNEEPDPTQRATLHTKAFMIDRRRIFIGSFNWDPRSADINTEMGIFLDAPELVERFTRAVVETLPPKTYRVVLNDEGYLRWIAIEDGEEVMLEKEPLTGFWKRLGLGFLRLLPIQGQL